MSSNRINIIKETPGGLFDVYNTDLDSYLELACWHGVLLGRGMSLRSAVKLAQKEGAEHGLLVEFLDDDNPD